jgi:hypothetical protein
MTAPALVHARPTGHRSDREGPAAVRTDPISGHKAHEQTVEPPGVGRARLFGTALEHVLAVEMRALAIGRGSGVDDNRLVRFEHTVQIRHRWIEREEIVELEC